MRPHSKAGCGAFMPPKGGKYERDADVCEQPEMADFGSSR
jgi:hypothetical protein